MSTLGATLLTAVWLLVLSRLLATPTSAQQQQQRASLLLVARPGCRDKCGNITIPYPFGIGAGCFRDDGLQGFQLECDDSRSPPLLTVYGYNHTLNALSLAAGEARAYLNALRQCYDSTGGFVSRSTNSVMTLGTSPYLFSAAKNRLVVLGCPNLGYFVDMSEYYISGCMSVCRPSKYTVPESTGLCTGIGCCQSAIPTGVNYFQPNLRGSHLFRQRHDVPLRVPRRRQLVQVQRPCVPQPNGRPHRARRA